MIRTFSSNKNNFLKRKSGSQKKTNCTQQKGLTSQNGSQGCKTSTLEKKQNHEHEHNRAGGCRQQTWQEHVLENKCNLQIRTWVPARKRKENYLKKHTQTTILNERIKEIKNRISTGISFGYVYVQLEREKEREKERERERKREKARESTEQFSPECPISKSLSYFQGTQITSKYRSSSPGTAWGILLTVDFRTN